MSLAHTGNQMIEKTKDSEKQSLAELQQELKSLKALLLSRPAPVLPFGIGRPSIPAWQLATPTPSSDTVTSGGSPPPVSGSVDKGKAPERMTEIPP
jgi:peroxin-14